MHNSQVVTVVDIKLTILREMMLCSFVQRHQCFRNTCCRLLPFCPESTDGGTSVPRYPPNPLYPFFLPHCFPIFPLHASHPLFLYFLPHYFSLDSGFFKASESLRIISPLSPTAHFTFHIILLTLPTSPNEFIFNSCI